MTDERRPVSISHGVVVCSDGAAFAATYDNHNKINGWRQLPPIPGTPAERGPHGS